MYISQLIKNILEAGASSSMSLEEFLAKEIEAWRASPQYMLQRQGVSYYKGDQDILLKQRTAVGEDGDLVVLTNLPNAKVVDNQYAKNVDQKVNYSFANPFTLSTDSNNDTYEKELKTLFDIRFRRVLKATARDTFNCGIGYLHPYVNAEGKLKFKRFSALEVLPFWADEDHTELDSFLRVYKQTVYEGRKAKEIEKVEYYTKQGLKRYIYEAGKLTPDVEAGAESVYLTIDGEGYNWAEVPLVAFKYNDYELPLIKSAKSLQDGINRILSNFEDNMEEDSRNTIYVIHNYDGTDLGEFRKNLATYGAVKVSSMDGAKGGIDTLTVEVNAENYKSILEIFKEKLTENMKALDAKNQKSSGSPNQMDIQSMYSDLDLDANGVELEFQDSLESLMWFVDTYLMETGKGDFTQEYVKFTFNRKLPVNESQTITDCMNSSMLLSKRTLLENHPYVDNVEDELKRIEEEQKEALAYMTDPNGAIPGQEDPNDPNNRE